MRWVGPPGLYHAVCVSDLISSFGVTSDLVKSVQSKNNFLCGVSG